MASQFTIEIPELAVFQERWAALPVTMKTEITAALTRSAINTTTIAKAFAPVRTGKLRSSIFYKVSGLTALVYTKLNYADWVEKGTGIYGPNKQTIVPVQQKVLATRTNPGWGSKNAAGYYIIGKSQSGQRPNPFFSRAAVSATPQVIEEFRTLGQAIINSLADA